MARARKSTARRPTTRNRKRSAKSVASSKRLTAAPSAATETFTCPDCGRTFARAAALGAHRRRAHGIAGQSAAARRNRATRRGAGAATGVRRASRDGASAAGGANRDQLLRSLFPAGVPPREDVIRAVNEWLDEADRLVGLR
jgi:predicted RNA-binding Zn-ribbon protein involved in translation (DUF1610 family)